jgi:hypothetical protein
MFGFLLLLVLASGFVYADLVVLYNGDHIEGRIVDESEEMISLLRSYKTGNITYVQKIKRSHIVSIERKAWEPVTQPAVGPASKPAVVKPELPSTPTKGQLSKLSEIIAKFQANDFAAIDASITKLIHQCSPGQLHRLSERVKQRLGISLADLAAEIHLSKAVKASKGRPIRLKYVTSYEQSSLIPRLVKAYDQALQQEIQLVEAGGRARLQRLRASSKPSSHPASSQPVKRVKRILVITDWLAKPTEFDGTKSESEVFAKHIRYTLSLLNERIRLDLRSRKDREQRSRLFREKAGLTTLERAVRAREGGALTPTEREAILAERQQQMERFRQELQRRRKENEANILEIIKQMGDEKKREEAMEKLGKELQRQKLEEALYFREITKSAPGDKETERSGPAGEAKNKEGN